VLEDDVGDASVRESVRARGVSSRIVNESGRVEGVMECQVEGDGLAIVIVYGSSRLRCRTRSIRKGE
jgi:hypothetical protein